MQIIAKGDNIKKHCEGYYIGKGKDRVLKESTHARNSKARALREAERPEPPAASPLQPTIVVNFSPEKARAERSEVEEPQAKKPRNTGTLDPFLAGVKDREMFLKDLTRAFAGLFTF